MRTRLTRLSALAAPCALLASLLTWPAAHALPVFIGPGLLTEATFANASAADCTATVTSETPEGTVPVTENGAPVSLSAGNEGRLVNDDDLGDVVQGSTSITGTGRVTSAGGDPLALDLSATGQVAASTSRATSACRLHADSAVALGAQFTVTHPGFITLVAQASPGAFVDAEILAASRLVVAEVTGRGPVLDGTVTVFLAPGTYTGFFNAIARLSTSTAVPSHPVQLSVHGEFALAGSLLTPVAGKGRTYLELPAARRCGDHTLIPTISGRGKQAHRIGKVKVFVNDALVQRLRSRRLAPPPDRLSRHPLGGIPGMP